MEGKLENMMKFLIDFKAEVASDNKAAKGEMNELNTNIKNMDEKLDRMKIDMNLKIDENREEIEKNRNETMDVYKRMEDRMTTIEKEMTNYTKIRSQTENIRDNLVNLNDQPPRNKDLEDQTTDKTTPENPDKAANTANKQNKDTISSSTWANEVEQESPQPHFSSAWARQISKQLEEAAKVIATPKYKNSKQLDVAVERAEERKLLDGRKTKIGKKTGLNKLKRWFGDETVIDLSSSESEANENENTFEKCVESIKTRKRKKEQTEIREI